MPHESCFFQQRKSQIFYSAVSVLFYLPVPRLSYYFFHLCDHAFLSACNIGKRVTNPYYPAAVKRYYIKADWRIQSASVYHPVIIGNPAYLSLFPKPDGLRRTPFGVVSSIFYLNKYKVIPFAADDINFTLPASKIAFPNFDALFYQMLTRPCFLFLSDFSFVQSAPVPFSLPETLIPFAFALPPTGFNLLSVNQLLASFALILSMESTKTRISATTS